MRRRDLLPAALLCAPVLQGQSAPPPSRRITVGLIGCGNQGINDLKLFLADERVQVVAVCDVNRQSPGYWNGGIAGREPARDFVEWHYGQARRSGAYKGCAIYEDFRELLRRPDIDAVILALPDHWHALATIAAARAGKDIYGEKPLALTIAEGRAMVNAVQSNNRIFQTGSQQRSDPRFRLACELVRNGRLGKLHTVLCGLPGGTPDYGQTGHRQDPEPVPAGFNYDLWLGPAPEAPYAPARCHVNFRWILDYSGGQLTDWGGHHPDIAQWGMGTELTGPIAIRNGQATWAKEKLWNTATDFHFEAVYASGVKLICSSRVRQGVTFQGGDGWVWVNRGAIEASPLQLLDYSPGPSETRLPRSTSHARNFIDSVFSRQQPIAPIEQAHRSISIAHLGNISLRLGRDLSWDPTKEVFPNDEAANRLLSRPYRQPWSL
ncbi:MAG: Gfo/Idh/MocA family oxidoreductase [Acidobacteria bacterium]|nr:Gfo/Idh/MocA family oxidoreductase [Acidobacteriota bacterium]